MLKLKYILLIVVTLLVSTILVFIVRKSMNTFVKKYAIKLKADPTNFSFIKNSISFIIYSLAIIFIFFNIPYLKNLGAALFAGAGVLAAIAGFASQKAFSNIISGIFILIFKPFRVGDTVKSSNIPIGKVEEITLRHTIIKDFENKRIVVPNSTMSEETLINTNLIDKKISKHVEFGISYDSNVDKAIEIIREETLAHPNFLDNRTDEEIEENRHPVTVRMIAHADFAVILRAYVWAENNDKAFEIKCDLLKKVKERFENEGIEIPFPYRTIVFKDKRNEEEFNQSQMGEKS